MSTLNEKQEEYLCVMIDGGLTRLGDMLLTECVELEDLNPLVDIDYDEVEKFISDRIVLI